MNPIFKQSTILITFLSLSGILFGQKKMENPTVVNPIVRKIEANLNQIKGLTPKGWQLCVGAGRANEGLRADWQEQLRLVENELGFKYLRMHGLLHDDMGVYFEDKSGNPIYNWQYIDKLYDFLLEIGMKPFVELSFMPNALASGDRTVFWWKGNITPPKSYDKWYNLIRSLTEHFTERYGSEEVKTWYFEVWNEPNHNSFFSGNIDDYFKLYDVAAKAIKSVNSEYIVGGPATAGNGWVTEIIEHCDKNATPIDFISTHNYGVSQGFFDATGETGTVLSRNPNAVTNGVVATKNRILASAKPNLELHYTEWSASYSSRDPVHDSYHSASFILDKIKCTETVANSMSYWVFTDIFEEQGPRYDPFHGGFGLLNYQSIKKPSYFAYQFLNALGETEIVNNDTASWICKNKTGDIQVLLWDFTLTFPEDKAINKIYYKRDLPSKEKGVTQLKLTNVEEGTYQLKIYKVGYQVNDAYDTYMKLGSPSQLTKRQVELIKDVSTGTPYINTTINIGNSKTFVYDLALRENDVYLVEILKK